MKIFFFLPFLLAAVACAPSIWPQSRGDASLNLSTTAQPGLNPLHNQLSLSQTPFTVPNNMRLEKGPVVDSAGRVLFLVDNKV
jgi:hypothetical protein